MSSQSYFILLIYLCFSNSTSMVLCLYSCNVWYVLPIVTCQP